MKTSVKKELAKRLKKFLGREPEIHRTAYVAPQATVIGAVKLGPRSSAWPGSVLRGDINYIEVGDGTNIQDGAVVHLADDLPAVIGKRVTVGHLAIVHACVIKDECLIGMRATILDGAVIGRQSIVGAAALVTKGMKVPPGSLVVGTPARVVRKLTKAERTEPRRLAEKYVQVAEGHRKKQEAGS